MTAVTDPLIAQLVGARKAAGLSQPQLAAIMYISRGTLGQLERGRHSPRLATLRPWAQALGLQPALVPLAYGPARDELDDALADPCDCSAHEEFRRQLQDPAVAAEWMRARVVRTLDVAEATADKARTGNHDSALPGGPVVSRGTGLFCGGRSGPT